MFDAFSAPDEISFIGASMHGKDKGGYKYNSIHPGVGVSGYIEGSKTLRWQVGYITKDSYGCEMWYGGASWFPFATGETSDIFLLGVSVLAGSKCLDPDKEKHLVLFPLPSLRIFPHKKLGMEVVFSPKIHGDAVWFVAGQFRYNMK